MNIICIGYYDKFSRFFISLYRSILKKKPNARLTLLSINHSGFLYSWIRGIKSYSVSFRVWIKVLLQYSHFENQLNNATYCHKALEDLIKYKCKDNHNYNTKHLKLQAIGYFEFYEKLFDKLKPDLLCCLGDSRLAVKVALQVARSRNIKTYFVEIGPFNTTIFDNKGVNANASISRIDLNVLTYQTKSKKEKNKLTSKYFRNPIYRGFDYITEAIFQNFKIYPPDLKSSNKIIVKPKKSIKRPLKTNKYLLIGQIPDDVNMAYHCGEFSSFESTISEVYKNLPKDSSLSFREHPKHRGKYSKNLYRFIDENNINFDQKTNLFDLIDAHNVIVVINSTVGLESIRRGASVVVLGNAYYAVNGLCQKVNTKAELGSVLNSALYFKPDSNSITTYFNFLEHSYLINGGMTDKNLISSKRIAEILLKND